MILHQIKVECQRPRCKRWRWHTITETNHARCEVCEYWVDIEPTLLYALAAKLRRSPYYRVYDTKSKKVSSLTLATALVLKLEVPA